MTADLPFPQPPRGLFFRAPGGAMVARNAIVTGDVALGPDASVWFHCVLRADEAAIRIGARSNVQDGTVIHTDTGLPCEIAEDVTIGHMAMIHGVSIGSGCLIGIQSVILGRARIGAGSVIAAGAVVREGAEIPPGVLVAGVPGKVVRDVSDKEREFMRHSVPTYIRLANLYLP
ncbi:MAG: gamma carbonic anhydrase family protein [Planctomycetota bacterium]|nr:MAG: gamma carbonic anhydrase family protein [Planctomycetota bacterium]